MFHQYLPEPDASAYIDTANASFALANLQAHTFIGAGSLSTLATGNTVVTGTVNVSSTFQVSGATTINNTLASGNTTVTGFANVSSTLQVTGATTLSSTLASGNTTITGFANVSSSLQVIGPSQLSNTVTVAAGGKYVQMFINGNANLNSAGILNGGQHNGLIVGSYLDASTYSHTFISLGYNGDDGRDFSIGTGSAADFSTATFAPRFTIKPSGLITFANSTATSVTIAANGNVGIGTSSPTTKLHVDGVLYATGAAVIGSYASVGSIVANDPGASYYAWNNRIGGGIALVGTTYVANNLVVGTTNLDVGGSVKGVRLSLDGKILASTDNGNGMFYDEPLYLDRRDASGDGACIVLARQGQYKAAIGVISNGGSAEGSMTFSTATNSGYNNRMLLAANGNFGIGATTPGAKLEIYKSLASTTTAERMLIINTDYGSAIGTGFGGSIVFRGRTAGNLLQDNAQILGYNEDTNDNGYALGFFTRPTSAGGLQQRMTILRNGNVGIGNTSPAEKLHLTDGKIAVSGDTTTPSTGHAFFYKQSAGATVSGYQAILETGSAGSRSTRLLIDFGGRMGLGTTTPWSHFTLSANSNNGSAIATNAADFGNSALIIHNQDDAGTGNKAALLFAHAGAPGLISGISSTKTSGTWQTSLDFYVNNTTGGANTGIIQHAMRIASDGKVGIGTAGPASALHIVKGNGITRMDNGDGNYSDWQQTGSDTRFGTQSNIPLDIYTNANRRIRIDGAGRVGVGVLPTSSWSGALSVLQIGDTGHIANFNGSTNQQMWVGHNNYYDGTVWRYIQAGTTAALYRQSNGDHQFYVANTAVTANSQISFRTGMVISNAGNVGVNVDSPSGVFHVYQTAGSMYMDTAGGIPRMRLGGGNGFGFNRLSASEDIFFGEPDDTGTWRVRGAGTISLGVGSSSTTMVVGGNGGNVGIGTTNPNAARLHVAGPSTAPDLSTSTVYHASAVLGNSDRDYGTYFATYGNGSGAIQQRRGASAVYYNLALQPHGGNVGIGTTSPAQLLDIRSANISGATGATLRIGSQNHGGSGDEFGNIEFYWGDPDAAEVKTKIYAKNVGNVGPGGGGAADLLVATRPAGGSLTEVARFAANGNVGIGNTSPAEKLHVQGNIRAFSSGYPYIDLGITTSNYFRLIHDNPNDRFVIGKNGSNHFIVDGAGGVYATGTRTRTDVGWTYGGTTTDYDGTYYPPWYKIFEYTSDEGNINVIMEIAVMADPNFGHGGVYNVMIMRHSNIGSEIRSIGVRHIGGKDNMLVLFNVGRIVYARSNALWGDGVYYRIISSAGAGSGSAANGQFPWALFGREANIPNYNGSNALVGQGWIYNGVPTDYTSTLNP